MNYFFIHLDIERKDPELTKDYHVVMEDSLLLYQQICSSLEMLTQVRFHYSLFHSRNAHLSAWLSKSRKQLNAVLSLDNDTLKMVMLKLMKLRDLDKRMGDKRHYKEQFLQSSRKFASLLRNESASQDMVTDITSRWITLAKDAARLREELEELLYQWKELTSQCDYLEKLLRVVEENLAALSKSMDDNCLLDDQIKESLLQLKTELADKEKDLDCISRLKASVHDKTDGSHEINQTVKQLLDKWSELHSLIDSQLKNFQNRKQHMEDSSLKDVLDAIQSNLRQTEDDVVASQHCQETLLSSSDVQKEISSLQVNYIFTFFKAGFDHSNFFVRIEHFCFTHCFFR